MRNCIKDIYLNILYEAAALQNVLTNRLDRADTHTDTESGTYIDQQENHWSLETQSWDHVLVQEDVNKCTIAAFPVQNFASVADSGRGKTVAVSNTFNYFFSQVGLSLSSKLPRTVYPPLVGDAVYRIDHVFQLEPVTDSWRGAWLRCEVHFTFGTDSTRAAVMVPDIEMTANLKNTYCVANTLYRRLSPVVRELRAVPTLFKRSGCGWETEGRVISIMHKTSVQK
ncbi:hypothetical protein J6590_003954 [Homalodisca vitripennis]|nr:hypothetical protein J6590_003954 [Homalodisca vitripennis]